MDQKIYYKIINKNDYKDLNETELAYITLKDMINYLDLKYEEINKSKNGKPFFKSKTIFFNYSHSKNYILIAISKDEIGVDIEEDRNISDKISKKYLNNIGKDERLKYWVIKESYVKLIDKPELLYEDIDISKIEFNKYILNTDNYVASIMYDGNKKELIEINY